MGYSPELVGENKIEVTCKGYDIKFLEERQWITYTTTRAGTGYLTIPYNRILISPFGVAQEDCKLSKLLELIKEGF
jgi:valyl-tRNA synthetase